VDRLKPEQGPDLNANGKFIIDVREAQGVAQELVNQTACEQHQQEVDSAVAGGGPAAQRNNLPVAAAKQSDSSAAAD
jgi:hypothetical protein